MLGNKRLEQLNYLAPIPVVCLDLQGNFIREYPNIGDAAYKCKLSTWHIASNLSGHSASTKGKYFFVYKEFYNPEKDYSYKHRMKLRKFKKSGVGQRHYKTPE